VSPWLLAPDPDLPDGHLSPLRKTLPAPATGGGSPVAAGSPALPLGEMKPSTFLANFRDKMK